MAKGWKRVSEHSLKGNAHTRADGLRRSGYKARMRKSGSKWIVYRGPHRERKFRK